MTKGIQSNMGTMMQKFICGLFSAVVMTAAFSGGAMAQYNAFEDPMAARSNSSSGVAGPDLTAVDKRIEGGAITVGVTSNMVVLFRNSGTAPVEVSELNLYPSSTVSAKVTLNQCSAELIPPGAECAMTVAVSGLQAGAWRVEMLVGHNGRTRLATASISGTVENAADQSEVLRSDLEFFPNEIDFGSSDAGMPVVHAVTLRNKTSETIEIEEINMQSAQQAGYSFETECDTLEAGQACVVSVMWTPIKKGKSNGSLFVKHTGVTRVLQVNIKGEYNPSANESAEIYPESMPNVGLLVADKEEIDFGTDIAGAAAVSSSLVNVGDVALTLGQLKLSGSDNGLSIARSGCREGLVLEPFSACPLTLNWVPSREGEVVDDVQVYHSGARGILILPVRGDAEEAVSRDTLAVHKVAGQEEDDREKVTPVLDGYLVTSHALTKAVIRGPGGSQLVRDGQEIVLAGVVWNVEITQSGVELKSKYDEVLLVFDRSLTSGRFADDDDVSSSGSDDDD